MDKRQNQVADRASLHRYRTEIPNLIDDMQLSVYAFRLYVRLKRVAGDHGKCSYSTRQLAQKCRMSIGAISKAKQELVDADLIRIERNNPYYSDRITIVDLWPANFAHFARESEEPHSSSSCSASEQPVHALNAPVHELNAPVHGENSKEEPIKKNQTGKNPIRKEPAETGPPPQRLAAAPHEAKALTPQQAIFKAICDVLGWDHRTLDKRDTARVAQAGKALSQANYSDRDIHRFLTEVWFHDWRWQKSQQRPTLAQLRQEIGKLRAAIPHQESRSRENGTGRGDGTSDDGAEIDPELQRRFDEHRSKRKSEGSLYYR